MSKLFFFMFLTSFYNIIFCASKIHIPHENNTLEQALENVLNDKMKFKDLVAKFQSLILVKNINEYGISTLVTFLNSKCSECEENSVCLKLISLLHRWLEYQKYVAQKIQNLDSGEDTKETNDSKQPENKQKDIQPNEDYKTIMSFEQYYNLMQIF